MGLALTTGPALPPIKTPLVGIGSARRWLYFSRNEATPAT